jgi:methionine synthase II (cobalamin-independent)
MFLFTENLNVMIWWNISENSWKDLFSPKTAGYRAGSRCVKPPVFGDVSRPEPMTVYWSQYAQSQTDQWVKEC